MNVQLPVPECLPHLGKALRVGGIFDRVVDAVGVGLRVIQLLDIRFGPEKAAGDCVRLAGQRLLYLSGIRMTSGQWMLVLKGSACFAA